MPSPEPGNYENSGAFDGNGDLILEEHNPVEVEATQPSADGSSSLPVVDNADVPTVPEESLLFKAGETVNSAVSSVVEGAVEIFSGNESAPTPAVEGGDTLIPVVNEPGQ